MAQSVLYGGGMQLFLFQEEYIDSLMSERFVLDIEESSSKRTTDSGLSLKNGSKEEGLDFQGGQSSLCDAVPLRPKECKRKWIRWNSMPILSDFKESSSGRMKTRDIKSTDSGLSLRKKSKRDPPDVKGGQSPFRRRRVRTR